VGSESFYFRESLLFAEEPPLIPSHEVFLSGCNMRCRFCYSHESLYDTSFGAKFMPEEFAQVAERRRREGAVNINLLGGEPTVHLLSILKMLRALKRSTAVVWNSNFYMSEEAMRLLSGVVDLFVGDMRFGNNACAANLADTERYFDTACRNYLLASKRADLVVRHLLLPGHVECCFKPIARWVSENLPGVPFNLMFGYTPFHMALADPALACAVSPEEEAAALKIAGEYGLNIKKWMRPLARKRALKSTEREEISTTITVRPDGKIGIMHLHAELLPLVQALETGGEQDG
jgi:putative pyruvate formate lyase activating enzyme